MNKIFKNENSIFGKLEKFFWKLYEKESFRFLIAGGINTLLGLVCTIILRNIYLHFAEPAKWKILFTEIDIPYLIIFIALLPVAYTIQVFIAFRTKWKWKRMAIYPLSSVPNFLLQQLFIWLFETVIGLNYNISYFLAPICALPLMFFIIKFLVQPVKGKLEKKLKNITTILCDIDGTLIDSSSQLQPETIESVKRIKEKYDFYLISGRNFDGMKNIYDKLELNTPLICGNGTLIVDKDRNILKKKTIEKNIVIKIYDFLQTFSNISISIYDDFNWYVNERNNYTKIEEKITNLVPHIIFNVDNINDVSKIMIIASVEETKQLLPKLRKNFKKYVLIRKSKPNFIEISNKQVNKGLALKFIKEQNNLNKKEIMTIGDSIMDEPMFDYAGFNVVVGNANDSLKHLANFVTESNDDLGVKNILDKLD